MTAKRRMGAKVRSLRRREGLTQQQFAQRLDISTSYLNLIENDRRPLTANVLIRLAGRFQVDLEHFSGESEAALTRELHEVLGDPFFEENGLNSADVQRLVGTTPEVGRALVRLYREHVRLQDSVANLAARVVDGAELPEVSRARLPTELVNEFIQSRLNYFPPLEQGAARLWRDAQLAPDTLSVRLVQHLEQAHGVMVTVMSAQQMKGLLRRYDPERQHLMLSEQLPAASRRFQLALQAGLLLMSDELDALVDESPLRGQDARTLLRVSLANYFAGATLMPYDRFIESAESLRYDLGILQSRFQASFEQVCHRLTTLRRPGASGVPLHFIRIDLAGNISKRFSASGIQFARFGSGCARWNVYAALNAPGHIRRQISTMPDGTTYFCIAMAYRQSGGGYHDSTATRAIGLGCTLEHAPRLVYADGINLEQDGVPIGVSCRVCAHRRCPQRAFPSLYEPIQMSENVRGRSFFSRDPESGR
ncbi:MAG: short-chain fatty acyl-CoA regulator family protein [Myxococcota bacterium]